LQHTAAKQMKLKKIFK